MELRADVWDRVMDFASLLGNEDQTERFWANYNALRDYCEEQIQAGYNHPFLWESLADFTPDNSAAIPLYLRALEAAQREDAREYRVSIRFALAERYKGLGQDDLARDYAVAANDEARDLSDLELRREISRFLLAE